jgi:hypothetical protein
MPEPKIVGWQLRLLISPQMSRRTALEAAALELSRGLKEVRKTISDLYDAWEGPARG